MVGGDNGLVFKGESVISESTGTLGPSLRGKAPIFSQGEVIGVVSVGYLQTDIEKELSKIQKKIFFNNIFQKKNSKIQKKTKKLHKSPCGFFPIRIHHGHRRGGHDPQDAKGD